MYLINNLGNITSLLFLFYILTRVYFNIFYKLLVIYNFKMYIIVKKYIICRMKIGRKNKIFFIGAQIF